MAANFRRGVTAGLLVAAMTMSTTAVAAADTITQQFRGDGSSDFGLALFYARWDARRQAERAGFTDTANQCREVFLLQSPYIATVIWECTREL